MRLNLQEINIALINILLEYVRDSNCAAHSADSDIF